MMKNSFAVSVIVGACALAMNGSAVANVIKLTDDATLLQQQGQRYFSQSGLSGDAQKPLETAGADMPLKTAVKLIVPPNWKVESSGNYADAIVSWTGGLVWPQILNSIAQNEGIFVHLDWTKKIAAINAPGKTKTSSTHDAELTKNQTKEERQAYRKEQRSKFEKRDDQSATIASQAKQIKLLEDNAKKSTEASQAEVARIAKYKSELEEKLSATKELLSDERSKVSELETKYSVVEPPKNKEGKRMDAVELYKEYKERWVLPDNDSFDYYKDGGHGDVIGAQTPATFIAKEGTIEEVLTQWGKQVGWFVDYQASVQHMNPYEVVLKGTFFEVSTSLVSVFLESQRPINISYYPDVIVNSPDGTRYRGVVKITDLRYNR